MRTSREGAEGCQIHQRAPGEAPMVEQLHLSPAGARAILVSEIGIYYCRMGRAAPHPNEQTLLDHLQSGANANTAGAGQLLPQLAARAISPDGHLMCVGDAGSYHVLDADFRDVASVSNREEAHASRSLARTARSSPSPRRPTTTAPPSACRSREILPRS
ncbi:MAG: hypothetical protein R3F11_31295 [Verrucomicrobiales bacterium]